MLRDMIKRCTISLLAIAVLGGALSPSVCYAKQTELTKPKTITGHTPSTMDTSIIVRKYRYPYYYRNGSKIGNSDIVSEDVYQMYMSKNKYETMGWANPHVSSIKDSMKSYIGLEVSDLKDIRNIDTTNNINYTSSILLKIDESLGSGISDRESLMYELNQLNSSQGASNADLTNLNQRFAAFLYMRLNPSEFVKSNKYRWKNVSNIDDSAYSEMLNSTLELGHSVRLSSLLNKIGIMRKTTEINDSDVTQKGNSLSEDFTFSLPVIGVLSLNTAPMRRVSGASDIYELKNPNIYNISNEVLFANEMALYICLSEYASWYLDEMPTIASTTGWENDDSVKSTLTFLKVFNDTFGTYVPVITSIYEHSNSDAGNMSIKDMVERAKLGETTIQDAFSVATSTYTPHTDSQSPITQFYTANSDIGITSYNRDKILADVEVDKTYDELAEKEDDSRTQSERVDNDADMHEIENTFLNTQSTFANKLYKTLNKNKKKKKKKKIEMLSNKKNSWYNEFDELFQNNSMDSILEVLYYYYGKDWEGTVSRAITDKDWYTLYQSFSKTQLNDLKKMSEGNDSITKKYLKDKTKDNKNALKELAEDTIDFGIDENGTASSLDSVIINKFIVEGMGYSTSYIPMRTNVYNADVLNMYKGDSGEDSEFYEYYKKYGFMRKALLKDVSSTSAMDYYNAGGKLTNSTKVCTLRDILYSGNQDVTLYLDSSFYNAEDAIIVGNNLLNKSKERKNEMAEAFQEYASVWENSSNLLGKASEFVMKILTDPLRIASILTEDNDKIKFEDLSKEFRSDVMDKYKFDINKFESSKDMKKYVSDLNVANQESSEMQLSKRTLKTDDNPMYDNVTKAQLESVENTEYVNLSSDSNTDFVVKKDSKSLYTDDNLDTIVLSSAQINEYLSGITTYKEVTVNEEGTEKTTNTYTSDSGYSPMTSLAYVSCIYRDTKAYLLANAVENNNPVFMASDDLCEIKEANQWYRNTLLNYALMKNLIANAQIDLSFVTDLDCPIYMDIFGNILTESGIVVIPASCNATLHAGSFKDYNFGVGLFSIYGKEYNIPTDLKGALSVIHPYFVADNNSKKYVISAITMKANNVSVRFDKLDTYDDETRKAVRDAYKASIATNGATRLNWMAMVKIVNEVMRGAPIESIDKSQESLYIDSSKTSLIAAAKLEQMLNSFAGQSSNTLLCIPDFSRMDNLEYWIALLIKLMAVATTTVVIVAVYRDGVAGKLGLRTLGKSLSAIALAVSCIVVVPAIFQLTYYSANKFLLSNESLRILMINEEKRQGGMEIGVTSMNTVESNGEFALQLDWVSVPWYKSVENIMFKSSLDNLQKVKLEAYQESAVYDNKDVTLYNDGVYVTTDALFDSVSVDYTFNSTGSQRGLYLNSTDNTQTASFYSPYYVFLRVITANVNEYNRWLNNGSNKYTSEKEAESANSRDKYEVLGSYNYTTKYVSGERLKTVGLCEAYFTSKDFMQYDTDLLRLYQIYMADKNNSKAKDKKAGPARVVVRTKENGFDRSLIFSDEERKQFQSSYWYDSDLLFTDMKFYNKVKPEKMQTKAEAREAYIESRLKPFYSKVEAMDSYARDFIASNKDMLGKITDETFIKTMALAMAIKYNQLFGVNSANSIEIYNMDSEDLIRLCLVPSDQVVISTSMSYSRFVYNFGGEVGVYMAAILSIILWVGSFIKPLCTVIAFLSIFLSIFVHRVVLDKPSANLWGYFITSILLCSTNILHAIILKIGVSLPSFGLSTVGCMIFLIAGQVLYLLLLSYVTGVSLKDWSNLGADEYDKEAKLLSNKFRKDGVSDELNGNIKHYDNNWDYYNSLVDQHRKRNR